MKKSIYLDFNATGQPRPEVLDAVHEYLHNAGNPSSVHHRGRIAKTWMENAREQVARLVNCEVGEVVFNSGGTEATNQALKGVGAASIIIGATEHDATIAAAYNAGAEVHEVPVDKDGILDVTALKKTLAGVKKPVLVSVMRANNETGVLQPVKEIAKIAHDAGALVHCDGVQAAGKIPVDFKDLGVDMMSLASHKINGLTGTGALIVKASVRLSPLIIGGGQEKGWRSGTENVVGIVAFGKAAEIASNEMDKYSKISMLRDKLEAEIKAICPDAKVFGAASKRLPNTTMISMPGVPAETQVMAFDLEGICVSSGAACSSGKVKASHVLKAMGAPDEEAGSAIRVSMGWQTAEEDIEHFIAVWQALYERAHAKLAKG